MAVWLKFKNIDKKKFCVFVDCFTDSVLMFVCLVRFGAVFAFLYLQIILGSVREFWERVAHSIYRMLSL